MRVLIATAGTRGDVVPYTGLGARLREAGYDVAIAAHEAFGATVRDAGLELRAIPGNMQALLTSEAGGRIECAGSGPRRLVETLRVARLFLAELADGIVVAAQRGTDVLLLSTRAAPLGWHVADAMGIPSLGVYLQPLEPTAEFPPVTDQATAGSAKQLRKTLGLSPLSPTATRHRQRRQCWPVLRGVSPTVLPRPRDWRPGLEVVGYWFPPRQAGWTPPDRLVDFLHAGEPPRVRQHGRSAWTAAR